MCIRDRQGLDGFANWYSVQAQEERDHALLFMKYMQNNDAVVTLEAVEQPIGKFADYASVLSASLEHERYVTGLINNIYDAAHTVKDYRDVYKRPMVSRPSKSAAFTFANSPL